MKSIAILAMLATACISRNAIRYAVFIDPNLGSENHKVVHDALLDWKNKTANLTFTEVVRLPSEEEFNEYDTFFIQAITFDQIKSICGSTDHRACNKRNVYKDNGTIYLLLPEELSKHSQIAALHFPAIVRHEIGHAFGLSHYPRKGTTMFEDVNYMSNQITPIDADSYLRSRNVRP